MRKTHEDVPLEPANDGSKDTYVVNEVPKGMALYTKKKVWLLVLLLIILIVILFIIVIVLAVLLGNAKSRTPVQGVAADDDGQSEKEGGNKPTNTTTAPPTSPPSGPWDNIRLPRSIVPSHYDLHLNVDPNKDGFSGHESISIDVTEDKTPYILIHSNGLNITETSISSISKSGQSRSSRSLHQVSINKTFEVKKNNFHVIKPNKPLSKGNYKVELKFSGVYRTSLFGLFKGVYKGQDKKMAAFISTQLEPLDARTVFPCFDEPALKATFKISFVYPKDMVGLSNNEVEKEETKGEKKFTDYKKTPKMSTYLVSIVVGHFQYKQLMSTNGVKLRAYAQPGNTDQMDFALKMGNETLTQMENTWGIKYPMPKLDFVAPPECFIAMENWGSIRFEEDGLLYKKDFSSEEIQQDLLIRWLVHEVVHMWFGNYVTTKWWDDIWLNEAVTDFFTYHDGSPQSLADWIRNKQFIHTNLGYALELDGLINSRPVVEPTPVPSIDTFDDIVYKKGSALLNMVKNSFPTKINFNEGMKQYLNKHAYANAVSDDVWEALQSKCAIKECPNFKESMKTWMTETNYPVLTVKKGDDGKYFVQQERFVYDKDAKVDNRLWRVRFTYFFHKDNESVNANKHQNGDQWIRTKKLQPAEKVTITWDGKGWIKGNTGQTGFYRVNYDDMTWASLAAQLLHWHTVFTDVDRYGLIDDAFNLVRGGRLSINRALDITLYLNNKDNPENDYLPWVAVQKNLGYILSILPDHSHTSHHLKRYLAYQSSKLYHKLGFENNGSHIVKLLRMIVVGFECNAGSISCMGNVTEMFRKWKNDPLTTSVTPALRKFVYFYGVRQGTPEDWEQVLKQLKANTIASEYQPLLMGLAGSRDKWTLYRTLKLLSDEKVVKEQYAKYLLDDVANHNPDGSDVTWTFLQLNWQQLKNPDPVGAMIKYLPTITKRFSTPYQLELLEKFINENLNGQPMPRLLRKTIEIVRLNIAWRKAHESDLEQWLKEFIKNKKLPADSQSDFTEPA